MRDLTEIKDILKDFHIISGFRISIHNTDFHEICSYPENISTFCSTVQKNKNIRNRCIANDTKAFNIVTETRNVYVYKCQCGLIEAVSPIYNFGVLSGYLMIGQVCEDKDDAYTRLFQLNNKLFETQSLAQEIIHSIPAVPSGKISSYVKLMTIIAEYLTRTNKLSSYGDNLAPLIREYINLNFSRKISLDILADKFGCCKSTLIHCFKQEYQLSINQYISQVRMNAGAELLQKSNQSIKEIANSCGIPDQNYFSKLFTRHFGCSPREYKNKQSE